MKYDYLKLQIKSVIFVAISAVILILYSVILKMYFKYYFFGFLIAFILIVDFLIKYIKNKKRYLENKEILNSNFFVEKEAFIFFKKKTMKLFSKQNYEIDFVEKNDLNIFLSDNDKNTIILLAFKSGYFSLFNCYFKPIMLIDGDFDNKMNPDFFYIDKCNVSRKNNTLIIEIDCENIDRIEIVY